MKTIVIFALGLLINSVVLAAMPKRQYYINTPNGPVPVITPQQYRDLEKNKDKNQENGNGVGQEFISRAEVSNGEVKVYIRGCSKITVGNINDKDGDPELINKLKTIRNGDQLKIKMSSYGKCEVGSWKK